MARETYVEVRLFSWDAETDGSYPTPPGLVDARALPFANHANATAVFERAKRQVDEAAAKGTHLLTERVKPGPPRRHGIAPPAQAEEPVPFDEPEIALEEIAD